MNRVVLAAALLAPLSCVPCESTESTCVERVELANCPGLKFSPDACDIYPGSEMVLLSECAGPVYGFRLGRDECPTGTVEVWCE